MSSTSGTADQILALPKGGGAVQGLGESFQPDFHTGTGSYAIPLDLPNGPNDIAPKLTLLYHTAAGNGPFGMGFSLNLFTIARSTDRRIPTYGDDDPLVLLGGGELIAAADGNYRLRVDSNGWLIARDGEGFRITDRDGKYYRLGISEQARLFAVADGAEKILRWQLEEIEDPQGNKVSFTYLRDGLQLYLASVQFSIYKVNFTYEERPDPILDGRSGLMISTNRRCTKVELLLDGFLNSLVRRWELEYAQSAPGGHSLLRQVKLTGFDEGGQSATLPALKLDYTTFQPRRLERFKAETPNATPGALLGGRRELLDWDGDGLPDLLEIGAGATRIWPNRGDCTWGRPESLDRLPVPVALDEPGVAFADMQGNGTADLVMLDRPLSGFYPHLPRGGFGAAVFWPQVPNARLSDPATRLMDLDADGIIDMLVSGDKQFNLYYRRGERGWDNRPTVVPRPQAPPVSLSDPRIYLGDMNGDGLQDLLRVDGSGVTYWPYLGNGRWDAAVRMANPPLLPERFDATRLFVADIDGDGCADIVYVAATHVVYWLNQQGTRFSDAQEIKYTPPADAADVRMADMRGNGTGGLLWSYQGPGNRTTDYFYLDFSGGMKPYLLNRIDNGLGMVTEIEYGTSTAEAIRDRRAGHPWSTFLPFPVPVVSATSMSDQVTGRQMLAHYRYHDGHFDSVAREFCGFAAVEIEEVGDEAVPTKLTRNHYHIGLDPNDPDRALTEAERTGLKVLRGKLLQTEIYGADGAPEQDKPYLRTENSWSSVVVAGAGATETLAPRLGQSRTLHLDRQDAPFRLTITSNLAYDDRGNVTEQEQRAEDPRDATLDRALRTVTSFVTDATSRFAAKAARITQFDGDDKIVACTISYYDGLAEGQIGAPGLLTRQETLVLPDELVLQVYGATAPDFAALGYHRLPGEGGWWTDQVAYTRTDDAQGLRGTVTNGRGSTTAVAYDEHKIQPVEITDPLGNTTKAVFNYFANKLRSLTDANGATATNEYDPLGRLLFTVEPGATAQFPTSSYQYRTDQLPARIRVEQRAINGQAQVSARETYFDGAGQVIEERVDTELGMVIERGQIYSNRGVVKEITLPTLAAGADWSAPAAAAPRQRLRYDALGRLLEVQNPDGSVARQQYGAGTALLFDEEDTRSDAGATHANTPTRHSYDPTGRLMEVALNSGGAWLSTRYEHDVKGQLLATVDAAGLRSSFVYDLLGHRIQSNSPASGSSVFVFDANGNMVERKDARGEIVRFEHDALNRLTKTLAPASGAVFNEFTFHDAGQPVPAGAGTFSLGRAVKISHQGGSEMFEYDALGRVSAKRNIAPELPGGELRFDYSYRADGQIDAVVYPLHAVGTPRLTVHYEYNERGLLKSIPGFVDQISYNTTGQRTRIAYANGIATTYDYDPLAFRLTDLRNADNAGTILQQYGYSYDHSGNLLHVASPDPKAQADYSYDDLYRLTQASRQSGQNWSYDYDNLGNLTFKSDVGAYQYDANGLLLSAGADAFTYTVAGQTEAAPWGQASYDPIGRMTLLAKGAEQMSCAYNHEGRRVRMEWQSATGASTLLTPDDMINIENGVVMAFVVDGAARVAQVRLDTGAISFLHGDHLGSTTLVTDSNGAVLQQVYYDPFGAILEDTMAGGAAGSSYLYTGQHWDAWAGLIYLHARYYNPQLGRFLTPDTVAPEMYDPQAWNRYSYVRNNPLRYIDPTGHFWDEIGDWFKDNWKYVAAAVAIVAVAVLTVVTFGAAALILVGIGMAIGGVVGGIAAAQSGGDVLLGVLVGMAVGGAAAFGGMGIGAGMSALFGANTFLATTLTGVLAGAVNGAAMGFAAGFAGGQGSAGDIWQKMWQGALAGAISGAVFGATSFAFGKGLLGSGRLDVVFPKGAESLKKMAVGFAAGSLAELGREGAAGKGLNWMAILGAGAGAAGLSSMANFGGTSGLPTLEFLRPEYVGIGASLFAQASSSIFVLDYADDIWKLIMQKGVSVERSGKF